MYSRPRSILKTNPIGRVDAQRSIAQDEMLVVRRLQHKPRFLQVRFVSVTHSEGLILLPFFLFFFFFFFWVGVVFF
jgi:hypothetical protein